MKKSLLTTLVVSFIVLSVPTVIAAPIPAAPLTTDASIEYNKLVYGANYVAIGNINVATSDKIMMSPDLAEFSIKYLTEGNTPNDASNRNAENMKILISYMETLGIKKNDLTTISYQNFEKNVRQPANEEKQTKHFITSLTANIVFDNSKFYDVVKLLEKNKVNNLAKNHPENPYYTFVIETSASDEEASKKLAEDTFNKIQEALNTIEISQLAIEKYNNKQETSKEEDVKKYYVQNVIKVRVHNFDNIGKIFTKAQELKMSVNNDLYYDVSEKAKKILIQQSESKLLAKLSEKAKRVLGENSYQLGVPTYINIYDSNSNSPSIRPANYGYDTINAGQAQLFKAEAITIQTPSQFEIILTMSGTFEVIQKVNTPQ